MAHIITLPTFSDERGCLTVIDRVLDFPIRRVFYLHGVGTAERGGHRHRRSRQAAFCVKGRCTISCNDGLLRQQFVLDHPGKGLVLEPADYHTMGDFSEDAVLLVLASNPYDPEDYIFEDYSNPMPDVGMDGEA